MNCDEGARLLIQWAWAAAGMDRAAKPTNHHFFCAFALLKLRNEQSLGKLVLQIEWPVAAYAIAKKLDKLKPVGEAETVYPAGWAEFLVAHKGYDGPLTAADFMEALLYKEDTDDWASEVLDKNPEVEVLIKRRWKEIATHNASMRGKNAPPGQAGGGTGPAQPAPQDVPEKEPPPPPIPILDLMRVADINRRQLKESLKQSVVGQHIAVEMLVDAYFRIALYRQPQQPQGVFTFIGPPGVGKTLLAESFAKALSLVESKHVAFKRFDMSCYAGHQSFEQLFGAETFWVGNQPGTLTGFVQDNPSAVILFDEIEKAHHLVLASLLPLLDKGEAYDRKMSTMVSFKGCWLIFTTNLGREVWNAPNGLGLLDRMADAKQFAWDLLAKSYKPDAKNDEPHGLSPEFVSRLAKGEAVFFRRLEMGDLQKVLERVVKNEFSQVFLSRGLEAPKIEIDSDASRVFLLTLAPRLDARKAASQGIEWMLSIFDMTWESIHFSEDDEFPKVLKLTCGASAKKYLTKKLDKYKPRLLLVDDDDYLEPSLREILNQFGGDLRRTATPDDAERCLSEGLPDVVFLDLSINEKAESSKVESALSFVAFLTERLPHVPIYLYSVNPRLRGGFFPILRSVMKSGNFRNFFGCEYEQGAPEKTKPFLQHVHRELTNWRLERALRDHERANISLRAGMACRLDRSGSLVAEISSPNEVHSLSAPDLAAGNFYQGVPRERFDQVVGLTRAKKRLQFVRDWLQKPGILGRFGFNPPRGYLLAGPPGTGKTFLAKALAGEARLPFLAVAASQLSSLYSGEAERMIRELFEQAERYAPSIIFIDEIDALAASREEANARPWGALSQLLVCMDGIQSPSFPVFVLAATNEVNAIDRALLRPGRFDEVIPIDLPNREARKAFFERRLKNVKWEGQKDLARIALYTYGCTPAELDRIVRETSYSLESEGKSAFTQDALLGMARLVKYGAENPDIKLSYEDMKGTAWHEAGHALVSRVLRPQLRLAYLTIIPNDRGALGLTASVVDVENQQPKATDIFCKIVVDLAGRAAELLLGNGPDKLTAGCASDLAQATSLAYEAITRYGIDPEFGPLSLATLPPVAQSSFQAKAAERAFVWIRDAEKLAAETLGQNADKLKALAEALLKAESLEEEDIDKVLGT
jgi:ATP-dependent Zn protease